METQLVCPSCRAENLAGALVCYRCNAKMPAAPTWTGPASFKVYDASKDRGMAYIYGIVAAVVVLVSYFLAWLGVPKGGEEADTRGTSAFDILLGSTGSKSAIGRGGVGDASVGLDVRLVLLIVLLAALASIAIAIIKPMFGPLLACGLIMVGGPVYFFLQLIIRNNAQINTPDLVSLLRLGFYGSLVGGLVVVAVSLRYRRVPTMQTTLR